MADARHQRDSLCGNPLQTGKGAKPGVFGLIYIQARSEKEMQRMRGYVRRNATDLAQTPGFLSLVTAWFGRRGYTTTAGKTRRAHAACSGEGAQCEAVRTFFGHDFAAVGMTGVWVPHYLNALWVRCRGW